MSSCAPVAGRLSQLFSPRKCLFVSAITFSFGGFITSRAPSLAIFLVGRTISGIGGAGILTISIILVLELTGRRRRGLFVGMVNAGFTTGVSLGAVIAGALLPVTGWVRIV
jgi:MFS family permease